jgi:hypothetical protein
VNGRRHVPPPTRFGSAPVQRATGTGPAGRHVPPPTRFGAVPAQPALAAGARPAAIHAPPAIRGHLPPPRPRTGAGTVQPACLGGLFSCLSSWFGRRGGNELQEDSQTLVRGPDVELRRPSTRSVLVGQGDFSILSDGDRASFGTITSCSAVYAQAPDGSAVVYHWPFTAWQSSSVAKMRQALGEIGWSGKDNSFRIKVYTQDNSYDHESVAKQVEDFAANLRETFTNNVVTFIYPDNYILIMTADGKAVLPF